MNYKLYFLFSGILSLIALVLFCGSVYWSVQIYNKHKEYKTTFNENDPKNRDEYGKIKYPLETSVIISQLVMFYFVAFTVISMPIGGAIELWQTGTYEKNKA